MLKTLIVEDNERFRQLLKELLVSRFPSISVEEAEDGEEGLRKVDAFVPHLVFMDIKLPGENGFVVTQKVKTKYPGIVVVFFMSSRTSSSILFTCSGGRLISSCLAVPSSFLILLFTDYNLSVYSWNPFFETG